MDPMTHWRNCLIEEGKCPKPKAGGSGKPMDRNAYMVSVRYWERHVLVLPDHPASR